jgi:hypothetical protein
MTQGEFLFTDILGFLARECPLTIWRQAYEEPIDLRLMAGERVARQGLVI